jgi:TRAP-type C4-dicarboxylate transport system permease small subunit
MPLKQMGQNIERGINRTCWIFNLMGVVMLFFMMLLTTADVVLRYVFNAPIAGSIDIVELMMVILVWGAVAYCAFVGGHVRVDVVYSKLPKTAQTILDRITFTASAFTLALITWRLGYRVYSFLRNPMTSPITMTLHIPLWPFLIVATLGSALFCLVLIVRIFHPESPKAIIEE